MQAVRSWAEPKEEEERKKKKRVGVGETRTGGNISVQHLEEQITTRGPGQGGGRSAGWRLLGGAPPCCSPPRPLGIRETRTRHACTQLPRHTGGCLHPSHQQRSPAAPQQQEGDEDSLHAPPSPGNPPRLPPASRMQPTDAADATAPQPRPSGTRQAGGAGHGAGSSPRSHAASVPRLQPRGASALAERHRHLAQRPTPSQGHRGDPAAPPPVPVTRPPRRDAPLLPAASAARRPSPSAS